MQNGHYAKGIRMNTKLNRNPNWLELAREANWSVEELAKQCGISSRTLYRYFIRRFGKHPRKWIGGQRQIEAIAMLKDGFSVKEVASRLGYKCPETFSREFKRHWGKSPTEIASAHSTPANVR